MIVVVVPIRGFRVGKARLAAVLNEDERAALSRSMATGVLEAAAPLPVIVVTSDDEVRAFALEAGATVLDDPGSLNGAAHKGVEHARSIGGTRAIIVHADLAKPTPFAWVGEFDGVTIVPDRHGQGTNLLALPTDADFAFAYGEGSRALHEQEARRQGLALRVCIDDDLGWDVDEPQDLP